MASSEGMILPLMYGQVTHIVDPSDFWLRMGSEAELASFKEFEQRLNSVARQPLTGSMDDIMEGCTVLVHCSRSENRNLTQWKRGTIIRIDRKKKSFDVFYIDYGNTEIVPFRRVSLRVPEDVQMYSHNCYRCALAGIKPRPVNCHGSRSFTHLMLEAETGLPTEEHVEEFAKDVVPVSCEVLYGFPLGGPNKSDEQSWEEMVGNSNLGDSITEKTGDNHQSWVTCSDNSSICPQDESLNEWSEQSLDQNISSGMHLEALWSAEEHTGASSESTTGVVVPGFNLSGLQQRRMPSAEELQREQDEMHKAIRRAKLQKDMIECQRHLENMRMTSGQGQKWGNSDLLFVYGGQIPSDSGMIQPTSAAGADIEGYGDRSHSDMNFGVGRENRFVSLYPESKGLKHHQEYMQESVSVRTKMSPTVKGMDDLSDNEKGRVLSPVQEALQADFSFGDHEDIKVPSPACEVSETHGDHEDGALSSAYQVSNAQLSFGKDAVASHEHREDDFCLSLGLGASSDSMTQLSLLPAPPEPHPSWTPEQKEYKHQEYIKQVRACYLKTAVAVDGIGHDVVCAHVHSLVSVDADYDKAEMMMVMEVLLEEAVKNEEVRDLALDVFNSYSSVLKAVDFLNLLKYCAEKFVKVQVGKMPGYQTAFATVLVRLLYLAFEWPILLNTVIQDFTLHCLEKWIIFNKRGTQTGLLHLQLEKMYLGCAELVLPIAFSILQASDPERVGFIFDQMREKVLETDVEYAVRSQLLTLLLKFGDTHPDSASPADRTEPCVKKSFSDQSVQVEWPSTIPSHTTSCPSPNTEDNTKESSMKTSERGCQTEDLARDTERMQRQDAMVQTEALETALLSLKSSISSGKTCVSSAKHVESIASVSGRARRRRAVLEHLSKQKEEERGSSTSSSPTVSQDISSQFIPAAQVCSQHAGEMPGASDHGKVRVEPLTAAGGESAVDEKKPSTDRDIRKDDGTRNDACHKEKQSTIRDTRKETAEHYENMLHQTTQSKICLEKSEEIDQTHYSHQSTFHEATAETTGDEPLLDAPDMSAGSFISAVSSVSRAVFGSGKDEDSDASASSSTAVHRPNSCSDSLAQEETEYQHLVSPRSVVVSPTETSAVGEKGGSGPVCHDNEMWGEPSSVGTASFFAGKKTQDDKVNKGKNSSNPFSLTDPSSDASGFDLSTEQQGLEMYVPQSVNSSSASKVAAGESSSDDDEDDWDEFKDFSDEDDISDFSKRYVTDDGRQDFYNEGTRVFGKDRETGSGERTMFTPEDFPPLASQPVQSSVSSARDKLSLSSIAADLLLYPKSGDSSGNNRNSEKPVEDNRPSVVCNRTKKGADTAPTKGTSEKREVSDIKASEIYFSEEDDKIPSDWEDRLGPTTWVAGSSGRLADIAPSKMPGNDHHFGAGHDGQGDEVKEKTSLSRPLVPDPAGDYSASQLSPGYHRSTEEITSLVRDSRTSPACESNSFSNRSSLSQHVSSPQSAVPYQRGDLASMGEEHSSRKPRSRKKFRPFDCAPQQETPVSSNERWVPRELRCHNCDELGHLRQDCQKPQKSLFLF